MYDTKYCSSSTRDDVLLSLDGVCRRRQMAPKRARDFVKKKQKVGKKKLAPTNATSTAFRSRSVTIQEQSLGADKGEPVSHRRLTAGELLTQLSHYSADVRHDALKGLVELLNRHPEILPPIASTIVQRALLMTEDEYARVRRAALGVLRVTLTLLKAAGALVPHEQTLCLRLQSALTHPERLIRLDALQLLQMLLSLHPMALVPPPRQIIPSLVDMLDTNTPSGDRAAASALDDTISTIWALQTLVQAQHAALRSTAYSSPPDSGVDYRGNEQGRQSHSYSPKGAAGDAGESEDEQGEDEDDGSEDDFDRNSTASTEGASMPHTKAETANGNSSDGAAWPLFGYAQWRGNASVVPSMLESLGAHQSRGQGGIARPNPRELIAQLVPLPALLVRCWVESGIALGNHASQMPRAESSSSARSVTGAGGSRQAAATVDCGMAVVMACKELLIYEVGQSYSSPR